MALGSLLIVKGEIIAFVLQNVGAGKLLGKVSGVETLLHEAKG